MKNATLLTGCLTFFAFSVLAQPCASGRYASNVFNTVDVTSNVTYGTNLNFLGSATTLKLDFYEPQGDTATARPLIIWVHGGSFLGGSKTDIDVQTLSERFAKKGYVCASIDYRTGFFPIDSANAVKAVVRAQQDLKGAIRFFYKDRATTNTYKIDTTRIFIGGSSAGAITALHVGYLNDECEISDYLSAATITSLGGLEGASGNPGYSTEVQGVINLCGALARYSWLEAGDVPLCSIHGTADATVKYNRGIVNPGTALMYLDGSRMLFERSCALSHPHNFYTFPNAPHVPYAGTSASALAYMDTTENFVRDFLIQQFGCTDANLQEPNMPMETANLYAINYCDGSPVDEVCLTSAISENTLATFEMYPNPTKDLVTLSWKSEGEKSIFIVDLAGRVVHYQNANSGHITLDVSQLKAGNYLVQIVDVNTMESSNRQLMID